MKQNIFSDGDDKCPKCGGKLGIKLSKFGAFIGCENYPNCSYTKRLGDDEQSDMTKNTNETKELGNNISFRIGKFGPYVTDGKNNVSAKKYTVDTITLEIATDLLNNKNKKVEPIELGKNPKTDKMIYFYPTGRYGAYISSNKVNISVKSQPDLDTAIDLINNKKTTKRFNKK